MLSLRQLPGELTHRVSGLTWHHLLELTALLAVVIAVALWIILLKRRLRSTIVALEEREERFHLIVQATNDALWGWSVTTDRAWCNDRFYSLFGFVPGNAFNLDKWKNSIHPEDREAIERSFTEAFRCNAGTWTGEYRFQRADGTYAFVLNRASIQYDEFGRPACLMGGMTDLTALRDSEQRYRAMFHSNPQPMWVFDVETLAILEVNEAAILHYGYSREEFLNLTLRDIRPAGDEPLLMANLAHGRSGYEFAGSFRHRKKDGTVIYVEIASFRFVRHGRVVELILANDITERKLAEKALQQSEKRFRALIEDALDIIVVLETDGEISFVSPSVQRILGYSSESELGINAFDRVHPDDLAKVKATFARALKNPGTIQWGEYRIRHQDGSWRFMEAAGRSICSSANTAKLIVNARDVTERRAAEDALRNNQAKLEAITATAADALFMLDAEGRITFANPAAEEMFGFTKNELLGTRFHEQLHHKRPDGSAFPEQECPLRGTMGTTMRNHEDVFFRKDGAPVFVSCTNAASIVNGSIVASVLVVHDVSSRKRAEQERESTIAFLYMANQCTGTRDLVRSAATFFQKQSGCQAVGVRLQEGDDYPYYEARGFPEEFVKTESKLCTRNATCEQELTGDPVLDCMCGNVIRGIKSPSRPFFTAAGSFWTNSTTALLANTTDADRQARTRNRCNGEGYESVALIPLRVGKQRLGLVQLNDRRKGMFSPETVAFWERLADHLSVALARLRAEEALKKSESRFRRMVESDICGIVLSDGVGTVHHANDAALAIYGCTRAELESGSINWRDLTPPEYQAIDEQASAQFRATGKYGPIEKEFIRKDGTRASVLVGGTGFEDQGDESVSFLLDISALKKANQERIETERRFQLLARAANDAVWDWDILQGKLWRNESYGQIFGRPTGDLLHDPALWADLIHEEDRERVIAGMSSALSGGRQSWSDEYRLLKRDGSYAHVLDRAYILRDSNGRPLRMVGAAMDQTEQRRIEQELRVSEANFRSLIENAPYGIYRSTTEGRFVFVNPHLLKILGYDEEQEVLALDLATQVYCDPLQRSKLLDTVNREGEVRGAQVLWKRKDGKQIPIRLSIRTLPGLSQFEVIGEDISQQVELEAQFRQVQKLEALGALAGGIAHDFNNILMIINSYGEMVLDRLRAEDPVRRQIEHIVHAGQRGATLTRQLLAFSRKQVLNPSVLNLNGIITDVQHMLQRLIGENIALDLRTDPNLWQVEADPGQVEQVVLNLAVNARDAMPRGGHLIVGTSNTELDTDFVQTHKGAHAGEFVELFVSDTGSGIDPEIQSRIFDPFFTTKEMGKGTGLGLSTVYGIVKQSGGYIALESELGKGTTFHVYLPRTENRATMMSGGQSPEESPIANLTILVVEDETAAREAVCEYLEQRGFTIIPAGTAEEALALCSKDSGLPQLLITDVVLPRMSGAELAEQLRSRHPQLKLIFMSGYTDDRVQLEGLPRDEVAFIQKPFSLSALVLRIQAMIGRSAGVDENSNNFKL